MNRWNIASIFFLGEEGRLRTITLEPGVNIITGASGTGKSTLIKAIDYCLGSSECELAAYVRRHSIAVGVKWISDSAEMITGRIIPPLTQKSSGSMFVSTGRDLPLPRKISEFEGATTLKSARALIERAFGIGDLAGDTHEAGVQRWRASVRHATAYMFVTKEVINNEKALLHGLDQADEAKGIIETMPYFLRVVNEESVIHERKLRELRQRYDREERRQRTQKATDSEFRTVAMRLLMDAQRCGMISALPDSQATDEELKTALVAARRSSASRSVNPDENELPALYAERKRLLNLLDYQRRRVRATQTALTEMEEFRGTVQRQYEKLEISEHIRKIGEVCPVCDSPSQKGRSIAGALQATLQIIRSESIAVESVKPRLVEHDQVLHDELKDINADLKAVNERIATWVRQNEENKRFESASTYRANLLGKVSLFLELSPAERPSAVSLDVLRTEIEELEAKVDHAARKVLLDRAQRKVSERMTKSIVDLPTKEPCVDVDIEFYARPPEVAVIERGQNAVLRMIDLGSDENCLAIHVALTFALQSFFKEVGAPVPGFLAFDQISRPYYPTRGEDETFLTGEDEEIFAMRKHINFLFNETAAQKDLQVLLIEHAYFADDPRYVSATRERWTRTSGNALIPMDWPQRAEL
ncbi:DUF3732 domain-containing protein [Pseudomonas yamanorum]|uniref:DUF3732 domain-containing protein n=1 Tax=Pseudomonas yamanorum TaxID=515393 RepID=UPI0015A3AEED|nr:DUF3732 domain-containing protein [Pseudomonas yamanorum]NVZ90453.1 DUF3732 domain-containing protein [Pseudomonas yamanorum]